MAVVKWESFAMAGSAATSSTTTSSQATLAQALATSHRSRPQAVQSIIAAAPLTLCLTLAAVIVGMIPLAAAALEYNRAAIVHGEWWRMITCHLTHWNGDHLFWDGAMFLLLGAICERRFPRRYLVCLGLSAVAISSAIAFMMPDMESYRGLSGVDTALFALAAAGFLRQAILDRRRGMALLMAALAAGLLGKILFEVTTGRTLFVDSAAVFVPLPLAHLVGACIGPLVLIGNVRKG